MKKLVLMMVAIVVGSSAFAGNTDIGSSNSGTQAIICDKATEKKIDGLLKTMSQREERLAEIVQDLSDINIDSRELMARVSVIMKEYVNISDFYHSWEKKCNGKYDLWTQEREIRAAQKAGENELKMLQSNYRNKKILKAEFDRISGEIFK